MVEYYLKQERTIVLCIVPANQDVATVDILERALRVDPTGERTIGVLTKPDLVGEGAEDEVLATLRNERKPLKLGYLMVKNRSAAQLKKGPRRRGDFPTRAEGASADFAGWFLDARRGSGPMWPGSDEDAVSRRPTIQASSRAPRRTSAPSGSSSRLTRCGRRPTEVYWAWPT